MSITGRSGERAQAARQPAAATTAPVFGRVPEPRAVDVRCDDVMLWIVTEDGRQLGVPLARFPRLADATPDQRGRWELLGRGVGIHWPDLDEDISVGSLFGARTD